MPAPRLIPAAPTRGAEIPVESSPFWIGAAPGSSLPLFLPGIAERHIAILEREDGYWVSPTRSVDPLVLRVNGAPVTGPARLHPGDLLEIAPGVRYRFETGEKRPPRPARKPPPPPPVPVFTPGPRPARRRRREIFGPERRRKAAKWAAVLAVVSLVLAAGGLLVYALTRDDPGVRPLSDADAQELDSLMLQSYERVERGTALLELGLAEPALQEFARAVNTLETSRLHDSPWVRPRIQNLEAAIASIYREKRIAVPVAFRNAKPVRAPPGPALRGALSVEEFARAVAEVQEEFAARFGRRIVVTGGDHAEHLSLYGAGGALDLRVRDLTREQVRFAIDACRARGIRVKDFSDDDVLRRQIASARAAGHLDRMGTGLHLHIDRFANRRDRWTVQ
ncbi:MAG TPA: FHA domain-containing protein [Longimicrobiaceae bacterium]|nr:FHA domain-containing protein [Longimicrobiaceae bacterium]